MPETAFPPLATPPLLAETSTDPVPAEVSRPDISLKTALIPPAADPLQVIVTTGLVPPPAVI